MVTLYHGGMYSLYRYKRFNDVRLVMAPEENIAFYGGDPDNFTFPRYDLDLTLLRVYDNDRPMHVTDYLKWSRNGASENEPVFVIGNPGSTGRLLTVAQMQYLRDVEYPMTLSNFDRNLSTFFTLAKKRGMREYQNQIFRFQNSRKAIAGFERGLLDSATMTRKEAFERDFRARIDADPTLKGRYSAVWDAIASAERDKKSFAMKMQYYNLASVSPLYAMAVQLVRLPVEITKPDSLRRPAYRTDALGEMKRYLSQDQVDTLFERLVLTAHLTAAARGLPTKGPIHQGGTA